MWLLFSCSVVSDSLQPHGLQHTRPPCPSPFPEFAQTRGSIEPVMPSNNRILCHPLLLLPSVFPSIRVFCSQVGSSHQVAKGLELKLQHQSFQCKFRIDFLVLTGLISLLSKGLSRVFSSTTVRKYQFLGVQPSLWSNSHICTRLLEKP